LIVVSADQRAGLQDCPSAVRVPQSGAADRLGFGGERGKSITGALAEGLRTLITLLASLI